MHAKRETWGHRGGLNILYGGCGSSSLTLPHSKPETGPQGSQVRVWVGLVPPVTRRGPQHPEELSPRTPGPRGVPTLSWGTHFPLKWAVPVFPRRGFQGTPLPSTSPRGLATLRGAGVGTTPPSHQPASPAFISEAQLCKAPAETDVYNKGRLQSLLLTSNGWVPSSPRKAHLGEWTRPVAGRQMRPYPGALPGACDSLQGTVGGLREPAARPSRKAFAQMCTGVTTRPWIL